MTANILNIHLEKMGRYHLKFIPIMSKKLSVFTLAMINVAAVSSVRNLPTIAEYGFASLFYFALAVTNFLFPFLWSQLSFQPDGRRPAGYSYGSKRLLDTVQASWPYGCFGLKISFTTQL